MGTKFVSAFNVKVRLILKWFYSMENITNSDRTLKVYRRNKSGSLLFRLCGVEFVGNFRLFEHSEFRKFPLSKFNETKEIRKSRVAFLFAYFFFGKAKKK
ncbi:hypothetical protein [Rodentibacter caecimuris]|nr:hypothetical protein [Rodentibacter heylii]